MQAALDDDLDRDHSHFAGNPTSQKRDVGHPGYEIDAEYVIFCPPSGYPDPVRMITLDLPDEGAMQHTATLAALRPFLARAQRAVPLAGDLSVLLTSDREMRRLNRSFRRKDRTTDVLSFPAPDFPGQIAGDLAISLDTAARQATQFGHSLQTELKILLLHGLLHLAGFDHETDAGEMAARENELRRRFRLPATLISRANGGRG